MAARKGLQFDVDGTIKLGYILDALILGVQYSQMTQTGFDGAGTAANEKTLVYKLGVTFLNEKAQVNLIAANQSIDFGVVKSTNTSILLTLSSLL